MVSEQVGVRAGRGNATGSSSRWVGWCCWPCLVSFVSSKWLLSLGRSGTKQLYFPIVTTVCAHSNIDLLHSVCQPLDTAVSPVVGLTINSDINLCANGYRAAGRCGWLQSAPATVPSLHPYHTTIDTGERCTGEWMLIKPQAVNWGQFYNIRMLPLLLKLA